MTEQELDAVERLVERLQGADFRALDPEVMRDLRELLVEVPWLVSEVRRLRRGPGRLGALLRYRRLEAGRTLEEVARDASLRPAAGSVAIAPEEVRALEEGLEPTGPHWPQVLRAIAEVLQLPASELR